MMSKLINEFFCIICTYFSLFIQKYILFVLFLGLGDSNKRMNISNKNDGFFLTFQCSDAKKFTKQLQKKT